MDSASWIWEENTTLVNDYNLKPKIINKWDRKILEKEYLKRLNKKKEVVIHSMMKKMKL